MQRSVLSLAVGFFALAASTSTQAQVLTLPEGTTGLTPLEGKVTSVQQIRVPMGDTVTRAETLVNLEFTLNGCLDSLMPLMSRYEVQGSRATIHVTALNAHNQKSAVALCAGMPRASAQVSIPGVFGSNQIRVVFMRQRPQKSAS